MLFFKRNKKKQDAEAEKQTNEAEQRASEAEVPESTVDSVAMPNMDGDAQPELLAESNPTVELSEPSEGDPGLSALLKEP